VMVSGEEEESSLKTRSMRGGSMWSSSACKMLPSVS
jgi:hypothetical protein